MDICEHPHIHTFPLAIIHFIIPLIETGFDRRWSGYTLCPPRPDVFSILYMYSLSLTEFVVCSWSVGGGQRHVRDLDQYFHFHEGMLNLEMPGFSTMTADLLRLCPGPGGCIRFSMCSERKGVRGDIRDKGAGVPKQQGGNWVQGATFRPPIPQFQGAGTGGRVGERERARHQEKRETPLLGTVAKWSSTSWMGSLRDVGQWHCTHEAIPVWSWVNNCSSITSSMVYSASHSFAISHRLPESLSCCM